MATKSSKRALIVKLGQIGDVIMALPAVRNLWEGGYEIHWVAGAAVVPLLKSYSWINVIEVDDHTLFKGRSGDRFLIIVALWRILGLRVYDLCATLYYDKRFRLLTMPLRARRRVVLTRADRGATLLAGRHHTDEYFRILSSSADSYLPGSTPPLRPDLPVVTAMLKPANCVRVALAPGGASNVLGEQALRRWPIELYVKLGESLILRGYELVLIGAASDEWVRPYFAHLKVTDLLGQLTLPEVVAACDACAAVVTHDAGPLHLAGLSTGCLIGVFGPVDPATRLPRRDFAVGIWGGQGFACRPCYDGREFAPCTFNGCMHQVRPELVLHELDRLLADRAANRQSPWRIVVPEPEMSLLQLRPNGIF